LAQEAARTYGKTVGHPAQLNFGDCYAYACAKAYRVGPCGTGDKSRSEKCCIEASVCSEECTRSAQSKVVSNAAARPCNTKPQRRSSRSALRRSVEAAAVIVYSSRICFAFCRSVFNGPFPSRLHRDR
jgi:hypothetical protein